MKVYVALGSNLGVPSEQLRLAMAKIEQNSVVSEFLISNWYRSKAIGGPDNQPDYLNAVCCFDYHQQPTELLTWLQQIEQESGRIRDIRWGPRTLDLDIIWCENFKSDTLELTVPHPRAHQRAFVLLPLKDLGAGFKLEGKSIDHWLQATSNQTIQQVSLDT